MSEPTSVPLSPISPISTQALQEANSKKIAAGVCALVLGTFGIHKFILGRTTAGLIMLLSTIATCGLAAAVFHVIGLVEGVLYLTKTDEQFYREYIVGQKDWF